MATTLPKKVLLLYGVVLALCLAWPVIQRLSAAAVWDDAFMFVRYARNLLADGVIAWNPTGEPTYGLTSNLYMLVVVLPLHVINPAAPAVTLQLASLISGLLFLVLITVLILRSLRSSRLLALGLVALALVGAAAALAEHLTSGMDTTFALLMLTLYLMLAKLYEQQRTTRRALALGICGGLLFSVRADLMIYAFLVPLFFLLSAADRDARYQMLLAGFSTALVLAAQLLIGIGYFGFWLPLPFYAKSAGIYGNQLYAIYYLNSLRRFQEFLVIYFPLFAIIGLALARNWRRWSKLTSPFDKAVTLATILFIAYYILFVTQIMGNGQRFYQPVLPALIYLAAQGVALLAPRITSSIRLQLVMLLLGLGVALAWNAGVTRRLVDSHVSTAEIQARHYLQYDLITSYRTISWTTGVWHKLDAFSSLDDDLIMATTDVGYPGILNPNKRIIDLGALNDPTLVRHYSAEVLFSADYRPDLLYMPFADYSQIIAEIEAHPYFQANYDYVRFGSQVATPGIAVRRDSRYYDELMQILAVDVPT